jgi:hypothetical protein
MFQSAVGNRQFVPIGIRQSAIATALIVTVLALTPPTSATSRSSRQQ